MAGTVIRLLNEQQGPSGGGGIQVNYVAATYDLLVNTFPAPPANSVGIVLNPTGIWPINRRLAGVYVFNGGWKYANQEMQDRFVNSQWTFKMDDTDALGGTFTEKITDGTDIRTVLTADGGGVKTGELKLQTSRKTFISQFDPEAGDDDSTPNRHSVGQFWLNTNLKKVFVAESLTTGAAEWIEVETRLNRPEIFLAQAGITRPNQTTKGLINNQDDVFETYISTGFSPEFSDKYRVMFHFYYSINDPSAAITFEAYVDENGTEETRVVREASSLITGTGIDLDTIANDTIGAVSNTGTDKIKAVTLFMFQDLSQGLGYDIGLRFKADKANTEAAIYDCDIEITELRDI